VKPESIGLKTLILSLAPVATKQYWYVSAYAGLFFIIPWINKLLQSCSKQEASRLAFILLAVFVIYVTFANRIGSHFTLSGGYSFVWLTILYTIGAWMKKCSIQNCCSNRILLFGILGCILLTWIDKVPVNQGLFVDYTSLTVVFIAFALVSIFSKLQLKGLCKKVVICFAPAAFGVYLIHVQPLIWDYIMQDAFVWIAESAWWLLVIQVLLSAFCIFVCCLIIEKCRLLIFRRLKIDNLINKIADILDGLVHKIYGVWIRALNL
jgi:surface polysaccharide O-acyltransferase-like enzyme